MTWRKQRALATKKDPLNASLAIIVHSFRFLRLICFFFLLFVKIAGFITGEGRKLAAL